MILEGLNQDFHQTPSSKERISLILSEAGETCAVKCIYLMNKSAMALKLLQQNTEMQGCIRWANWCGGVRTEVSLWDVALWGSWFLDVRSPWSSPQEVRLWSSYDSHSRKPEIERKLIFQTWEGECQHAKNRISKYCKCIGVSTFFWRFSASWSALLNVLLRQAWLLLCG